ncbi:MAG TPA: hypothetical protein VF461_12210 [Gemmatimonadaceae bacterium]
MLLALTLVASLHAAPADSISGKWHLKGDVVGNPLDTTCELAQAGDKITGVCSSMQPGGPDTPITGEVKGDSVTWSHGGDYQGTALTIVYSAKRTANKLEGTINVKPFDAAGTFTAEPVAAGATAAPKK